jgi:AraC family transcriptional regulator, positive regulator of tynA and feaB
MTQWFSTDLVPVSDRLDAWLCNAKQVCGDCRFHFPKRVPFHGSIERRVLGGWAFTRFASTPVSFAKFPIVSGQADDKGCIFITQLEGMRRYCQSGSIALLTPGDTTLIDAGRPWRSDCGGTCARLYLRMPCWFVQDRLRIGSLPVLPKVQGKHGLGATLFRLAISMYQEAESMSVEEGIFAIEAYLDILRGCVFRPESASTRLDRCAQLRPRVEYFIETHLSEPSLSPALVAAVAGISVRHLHRIFAAQGCTVTEWIRERRLERCRTDLADPRLRERNITDIAFFWGFSDSAHFSHRFRQEFGVSPREFRAKARSDSRQARPFAPAGFLVPRRQSLAN